MTDGTQSIYASDYPVDGTTNGVLADGTGEDLAGHEFVYDLDATGTGKTAAFILPILALK